MSKSTFSRAQARDLCRALSFKNAVRMLMEQECSACYEGFRWNSDGAICRCPLELLAHDRHGVEYKSVPGDLTSAPMRAETVFFESFDSGSSIDCKCKNEQMIADHARRLRRDMEEVGLFNKYKEICG